VVRGGLEAPGVAAHEFIDAEACERTPTVRDEHRRVRGIARAIVREEADQLDVWLRQLDGIRRAA